MDKHEVAQILREIGTIIQLIDSLPMKGIAYLKAANSIEFSHNFEELVEKDNLEILPGIGKKISSLIKILIEKGHLPYHEYLRKQIPTSLLELTHFPGLNVNKVRFLYENLNISSFEDLKKALAENKLVKLKSFSPSFVKKLKARILQISSEGFTLLFPQARFIAAAIEDNLKTVAEKLFTTGEIRRLNETIGTLYFVALSTTPKKCLEYFKHHQFVDKITSSNSTRAEVQLKQGLKAVLEIANSNDLGFRLIKTTGNENHVKELEKKISGNLKKSINYKNESNIYRNIGLHFIPPELREGFGEIEEAKYNDFSDLIEEKDLKGTFHCHTIDSDGNNTIEEMVNAAKDMGWNYIGISDHSKSLRIANGMKEERLAAQIEYIHMINKKLSSEFKIFAGVECDILSDGQLDVSEYLLKKLDFVIISIHSLFRQEKEVMTKRLIKAIENPYSTMVGHISGRLLRLRDSYDFDFEKVIDACIANDKIIELNCDPSRMDMDWRQWIQIRERGLKCSINPDAHSTSQLHYCTYGVNCARKGWLKKKDVINTLPLNQMIKFLKNRKPK